MNNVKLTSCMALLCLILFAGCEGFVNRTITLDDVDELPVDAGDSVINGIPAVFVKAGQFMMGCRDTEFDCFFDEVLHPVTLTKDYWISKYPITNFQFGIKTSLDKRNYPVTDVTWAAAVSFAAGKGGALPTEAQWEFAARGGNAGKNSDRIYSGSNDLNAVGWYDGNSGGRVQKVGQKNPNELGIYDMSGNVFEWCADWYGFYTSSAVTDPTGRETRYETYGRISRGGAWNRPARDSRVADRAHSDPLLGANNLGFRVVWEAK